MTRKAREILLLCLLAACLAFVLADSARFFVRLDVTRNKAYTISPVSRAICRSIPERVHILYYLSDTLRSLTPTPGRIIDFLEEYAAGSGGKVGLTVVDPIREGGIDAARRFGVTPTQVQVVQQNEQRTIDVFSGIVVEYLNRYTTLPAVFTPDGLEYSLSFAIRKLLAGRRVVIGVLLGRPDKSFPADFGSLETGLSRDYWLRQYAPGERIPPEVDLLLVLGAGGLKEADLRRVDRYLMEGGKILFAVKGLRVETLRALSAEAERPPLLDLLESYGVRVGQGMVLDTSARDYRLPQQVSGGITWERLGKYPPWVSIRAPDVSPTHPVTASFPGLDLLWPSPLEPVPVEGVRAEVLVRSSPSSWLMREPFQIDPFRVPQAGAPGAQGRRALAVALSGTFPSRFPSVPGARSLPTRIVVVGDDDFASDLMVFSDSLYDVLFIENAALWLSGNADLLTLKTKAAAEGRLDRVQDPAARRRVMLTAQLLNVAVIPLLVALFGTVRLLRRRGKAG